MATSISKPHLSHHARLQRTLEEIERAAEKNDRAALEKLWGDFTTDFTIHLETEEEMLIPLLESGDKDETEALLAEHAAMRKMLAGLGPDSPKGRTAALSKKLAAHAAREETGLYRVADDLVTDKKRVSLVHRLGYVEESEGSLRRETDLPFEVAEERVRATLATQGFGVLTEIDVQATLKKKLGVDFRRYTILGACNPTFAHQALQMDVEIGTLLPCNVVVYEDDAGRTVLSAVDPSTLLPVDTPGLEQVADEVRRRLATAIAEV